MASLHHSTIRFSASTESAALSAKQANSAEFISCGSSKALMTNGLLHPSSSVLASLIISHRVSVDTPLVILVEDQAIAENSKLVVSISDYIAKHPSLNNYSSDAINTSEIATELALEPGEDQPLIVAFGGQKFIEAIVETGHHCIAIVTRSIEQQLTDYDLMAKVVKAQNSSSNLHCVCWDSQLIIDNSQAGRSEWVVRGIQHALFHDSQMFHWIEGNLFRLFSEDRTAIDHLFRKVIGTLLSDNDSADAETHLHRLITNLWQNESSTKNETHKYAQAMTTTLLLCIQYSIQVGALEDGLDARVLFLMKQIVWLAPAGSRKLNASEMLTELPVLYSLGNYDIKTLDKPAMKRAEAWLPTEIAKLRRAA